MFWQVGSNTLPDRSASAADPNDAIVVEHDDAVRGQPDVALETAGAELQGHLERLDRVLRRPVPRPAMGESNRRVEERWQPLLHER